MSYLVMECRTGYAVVLDNQGRFQKVPNLGYEVGETLDFVTIFPEETAVVTPFRKKMASLAAAAACFLLLFAGSHQLLLTAYGTVRIQINPEVMLEINRLDYVIGLEGLNEDGSRLVEGYRYGGKRLESVSEELADLAIEEGYLRDGGEIVLTVESKNGNWKTDKESELTERIRTHLENKASVKVSVGGPVRDNGAGDHDLQQGRQTDGLADTPAGEPKQGNIGNPAYQTRERMEEDTDDVDDDRDETDDGHEDRDDDHEDKDDDREDTDDDHKDKDDDRGDTDDEHDDIGDDRGDTDDDYNDTDHDRSDTDDDHDDTDHDRDDTDDDREDRDDDRENTDDGYDLNDTDNNRSNEAANHNDTDDDYDNSDDSDDDSDDHDDDDSDSDDDDTDD